MVKKILGRVLVVVPAVALQILWFILIFDGLDMVMKGHLPDLISALFTILAVLLC